MEINIGEARRARLRRDGMVDAMVDCLALLQQDGLRRTIQGRVADASSSEDDPVREGAHDSYVVCQRWVAQGLDSDALAALIMQRIFAVWPREAADYQLRYDEFLEKELENPRATYYPSSREWIAAVEDMRDEVVRASALGQVPSDKLVRRCLKLLLTQTSRSVNTFPTIPPNPSKDIGSAQQSRLI